MKNTKIAIFGATGRVGSGVTRGLLKQGFSVLAIGRNESILTDLKEAGADVLTASFFEKDKMEKALSGYEMVMTLVPSNHTEKDFYGDQRLSIDSQMNAIKKNNIKHVVNLSSVSAHLTEGIGILNALHEFEKELNNLNEVKVVHVRPAYYMENAFYSLYLIHSKNANVLTAKGDHAFPMVAIKDVIPKIIQTIKTFNTYKNGHIVPILGPRDYTLEEFTSILGESIGKPNLSYQDFNDDQMRQGLRQAGAGSDSFIDLYIELTRSWEKGACNFETRTLENTTSTKAEEFAREIFNPGYKGFVSQFEEHETY